MRNYKNTSEQIISMKTVYLNKAEISKLTLAQKLTEIRKLQGCVKPKRLLSKDELWKRVSKELGIPYK